ncbi:Sexual differentiation process protein isp4 [Venturia nashicola]|uniref:Sexual differentiation process protein isp4 n=1 Tax=Venturia nashicola TaxID=86259 RepID=A0A4Z1PBP7_9PEZI|nr:Sexual differentiation process protein isp4 [Venturia nashicola]
MLGPRPVAGLQVLILASGVSAGVHGPFNRPLVHPKPFEKRLTEPSELSATWGPDITLGQTASEFTTLSTIYTTGPPPAQVKGSIFLWPGLFDQANRNGGDLIQSVVELHDAKSTMETCQAKPGQWCIRPFVVNFKTRPLSTTPEHGKSIDPGDKILIQYTKAPGPDGKWNQKITNLSKGNAVLFDYPAGQTPTRWLQIATEYQGGNTGTASEQIYTNTTVTVRDAEPGLGAKFRKHGDIQSTNPYSKDGGKTWVIDRVAIPAKLPGTEFKNS